MSHPRDRHIQHQHRASANTYAIASTDTTIPLFKTAPTDWTSPECICTMKRVLDSDTSEHAHTGAQPTNNEGVSSSVPAEGTPPSSSTKTSAQQPHKVTLDKLFNNKLKDMQQKREHIVVLRAQVDQMQKELVSLQSKPLCELSDAEMRRTFELETNIEQASRQLKAEDPDTSAVSYFMDTGDILFEYYDNLQSISKGTDTRRKRTIQNRHTLQSSSPAGLPSEDGGKGADDVSGSLSAGDADKQRHGSVSVPPSHGTEPSGGTKPTKTVVDFFFSRPPSRKSKAESESTLPTTKSQPGPEQQTSNEDTGVSDNSNSLQTAAHPAADDPTSLSSKPQTAERVACAKEDTLSPPEEFVSQRRSTTRYMSRQALLQQYLQRTDPSYVPDMEKVGDLSDIDMCPDCGCERILVQYEAMLMCPNPKCARSDTILVDSNRPSYKDTAREGTSYYSYKRINHFNEWLAQFQAKETTDIPEDVYHNIYVELKKERIHNMAKITPAKMKEILKRLKLNKYYEHIPHITNRINGQPAPVMTRATEEKLRSMFKEIQGPFLKHCPQERKNFLSYSFVLHKFCQLLGLDQFLPCFPLLKSREKLHLQDVIWEKICEELRWEFIKSV